MRDAAAAAAMSDPEQNRWFRRRWVDTVPQTCPLPDGDAEMLQPISSAHSVDLLGRELLTEWRRKGAATGRQVR